MDDAQWVSLQLVLQQIPLAWKRDEAALRRFVEAALWVCRTGAPWRDLPQAGQREPGKATTCQVLRSTGTASG